MNQELARKFAVAEAWRKLACVVFLPASNNQKGHGSRDGATKQADLQA